MSLTTAPGTLLLVTADTTTSQLLSTTLSAVGYHVTPTAVGSQILTLLAVQNFDVLLLDATLPDAETVLSAVRSIYAATALPVLLLTDEQDTMTLLTAFRLGANDSIPTSLAHVLAPLRVNVHIVCKRSRQALQASEERYVLTTHGSRDGLWHWNLDTNQLDVSPRWHNLLGYAEASSEHTLEDWLRRIHPMERAQFEAALVRHLGGHTPHFEHEYRMLHKDGTYRWVLSRGVTARNASGKALRMAGSQTDITDRKEADILTGLPNRTAFLERLRSALERLQRRPEPPFAVLLLDLDRFKMINESLGLTFGDQLLIALIQRLKEALHSAKTWQHCCGEYSLARLGGDEFAILLEDMYDLQDATSIATCLQQTLEIPFKLHGHEVFTTASIGIVLSSSAQQHAEDILRNADMAMQRAKARGRGCHEVFDTTMHTRALTWLQVETDMRKAVERQEFCAYYQPIVALGSGKIVGFEALARWHHPQRGLVPPSEFIPLAEDNGFIVPIGWHILRTACQQMATWQAQFPEHQHLSISANLSARQFRQHDMVQHILRILQQTQLKPHSLKLEITETALMDNPVLTTSMLGQLCDLGIQLSLDDFGTGYSSLSYLHRFPIQILKIDRSFISRMHQPGEQNAIVRTILSLATALNLEVVAEGIETIGQWVALQQLSCHYGQGYFFSKPLDAAATTVLLTSPPHWATLFPHAPQEATMATAHRKRRVRKQ